MIVKNLDNTTIVRKTIYTADDEMPNCGRCDKICGSYDVCCNRCGAEHGWNAYSRTVIDKCATDNDK